MRRVRAARADARSAPAELPPAEGGGSDDQQQCDGGEPEQSFDDCAEHAEECEEEEHDHDGHAGVYPASDDRTAVPSKSQPTPPDRCVRDVDQVTDPTYLDHMADMDARFVFTSG